MEPAEMLEYIRRNEWWLESEPGEIVVIPLGRPATVDDLAITKLKTEIVDGHLVVTGPSSFRVGSATGHIVGSLMDYEKQHGGGYAFGSRVTFLVDLPHRQAISPDAAWHTGEWMHVGFANLQAPFVAEVRDRFDERPGAEQRMAAKRADYFAAGTRVVWDVDVLREELVRVYRADDPENPAVYRRGEVAEAEPAVPGWRMPVDELFR